MTNVRAGDHFRAALHRLPEPVFHQLASGAGDEDAIRRLRAGQRSRRLLLLRAILDAAPAHSDTTGPLPPLDEAWQRLVAIQQENAAAAEDVLLHPHVGTWAGTVLRRLRGVRAGSGPLWATMGYLHALVTAAAIRAGLGVDDGRVPVHDGVAVLPTLGFARVPSDGRWDVVDVRRIDIPDDPQVDSGHWSGLRRLRAEAGGHAYEVSLDDLDPYRDGDGHASPHRVSPPDLKQWRRRFEEAWSLLVEHHRGDALALAAGLRGIVPRPAVSRFRTSSGTLEESFGSATLSLPSDRETLAVTLLHEFQHSKLGALLHLVPMYEGEATERLYAPWRSDPRPAPGLLQGVYAFLAVTAFWRTQRYAAGGNAAQYAHFEYAHWRAQTWRAWQILRSQPGLNEHGRRFVDGLGRRMEPWQSEAVPVDLLAAADTVARDHHANWRIRHVRPEPVDVARLADAWLNGRPRPGLRVTESVTAAGRTTPRDGRALLTRLRVADPAAFRAFLEAPSPAEIGDLIPGDIALAIGDHEAAASAYREQIRTDPNRHSAWVGLGLAAAAAGERAVATAVLEHPELVRALYLEVRRRAAHLPAPERIAAWLGS